MLIFVKVYALYYHTLDISMHIVDENNEEIWKLLFYHKTQPGGSHVF
jgi:hypothetical protein